MIKINFPKDKLQTGKRQGVNEIFDVVRRKWLLLTPEEWVRQNFVQFLLQEGYPAALIAIEMEVRLGELKKRCDIVVYNRQMQPWMIIECKEMNIPLSEKTVDQILRYHLALPADYLVITNGGFTRGFEKQEGGFKEITAMPEFSLM